MKKCKIPNYNKKMKHLLEKIKENQQFIESKRKDVTFAIGDTKAVKDWEVSVFPSTSLLAPYLHWYSIHHRL